MKQILDIPRTALEVFNMLPEGTHCEVIDNTLYMSPSPTDLHQKVLVKIVAALSNFEREGEVFPSPFDVYFEDESNVVQPDILFVKTQNISIIHRNGVHGIPDLVIEILSSNKEYDTRQKFDLYQRNRVPEYIIINPDTKEVWHYVLSEDKYVPLPSENGSLSLKVLNTKIGF